MRSTSICTQLGLRVDRRGFSTVYTYDDNEWVLLEKNSLGEEKTWTYELGHYFGFDHINLPDDIMFTPGHNNGRKVHWEHIFALSEKAKGLAR
jgi:hypothetical protein